MNQEVIEYLKQHKLAVISTVDSSGNPQAAVVAFTLTDEGMIIIGTSSKSRKFANISRGSKVAMVIGWQDKTAQLNGAAEIIEDETAVSKYEAAHIQNNPGSVDYAKLPDQRYVLIRPEWVRFSDFREMPPKITEATFEI